MKTYMSTMDTPAGPFTIVADTDGVVLASGFTADLGELLKPVHRTVKLDPPRPRPDVGPATKAALAYFDGDLAAIDAVPVRQVSGGEFLTHAWDVLRTVPAGGPISYTDFATWAGRPAAVRAAAQACGRNSAALFVPCHRVLRNDGSLGGFRWGLEVKRWLLDFEGSPRVT
jgi:methylated-DNA-[protein]-cysteine S-methyltransferase